MYRLATHIEFLLHKHNCVIIPGLGGFVVNRTYSYRDGIALFYPPSCETVFNRELTYNDGLLAESFMRTYDISFDAAMHIIEEDVAEIKQNLREHRSVKLGKLGSFTLSDDNILTYKPGDFVRPAYFGLEMTRLSPMIQIKNPTEMPDKKVKPAVRPAGVAAAAVAAVLMVLMLFVPMSDSTTNRQSAKISYETEWLNPKSNRVSAAETYVEESSATEEVVDAVVEESLPEYYIIMGVFRGADSAKRLAESLRDEGFSEIGFLERTERIDVYCASFYDETDARDHLKKIHKEFPNHSDAWILER